VKAQKIDEFVPFQTQEGYKMSNVKAPLMPLNSRNMMRNSKVLNFSRTSLAVLAGGAAGILGLVIIKSFLLNEIEQLESFSKFQTSVIGFLFYFVVSGLLGLYYIMTEAQSNAVHFMTKQQVVTAFVMENL